MPTVNISGKKPKKKQKNKKLSCVACPRRNDGKAGLMHDEKLDTK